MAGGDTAHDEEDQDPASLDVYSSKFHDFVFGDAVLMYAYEIFQMEGLWSSVGGELPAEARHGSDDQRPSDTRGKHKQASDSRGRHKQARSASSESHGSSRNSGGSSGSSGAQQHHRRCRPGLPKTAARTTARVQPGQSDRTHRGHATRGRAGGWQQGLVEALSMPVAVDISSGGRGGFSASDKYYKTQDSAVDHRLKLGQAMVDLQAKIVLATEVYDRDDSELNQRVIQLLQKQLMATMDAAEAPPPSSFDSPANTFKSTSKTSHRDFSQGSASFSSSEQRFTQRDEQDYELSDEEEADHSDEAEGGEDNDDEDEQEGSQEEDEEDSSL